MYRGHKHIIQLMIAKGANHWNNAVLSACEGGHKEIVESMIAKSVSCSREKHANRRSNKHDEVSSCSETYDDDANRHPNKYDEIASWFETYEEDEDEDENWRLKEDNERVIWLENCHDSVNYLNNGLYNACQNGHKEIAKLMIAHGANSWNDALSNACRNGHKKLIALMISKKANNCRCGKSIPGHFKK